MKFDDDCHVIFMFIKQLNIGRRASFNYRTRYDVTECSNCRTEERSEAEKELILLHR